MATTRSDLTADDLAVAIGSDLFSDITRSSLDAILPNCRVIEAAAGQLLIARGAPNQHLYLVLRGALGVQLEDGQQPSYTTVRPGECVGEISVIDGRGASANVLVSEPSRLLQLDRESLWQLIGSTEAAARNLLLVFSGRLRRDNDMLLASLRQRREFERMATVDGLTGLHNRRWLDDVFPRQMERCARTGQTLSLMFADVDHFKSLNDSHGHLVGDRALQHVASLLISCLRPTDLIARYGGEEFAALLPDASVEQATLVGERVRKALARKPIVLEEAGKPIPITVSLGVAQMLRGEALNTLTAAADAALYRAKSEGRDCVRSAERSGSGLVTLDFTQ